MVLTRFSEPTRTWFSGAFAAPTPAQSAAWDAISGGHHALVVAPTGSGKTLAAFLWAIDGLLTSPPPEDPAQRCRVLYVSPLKALATDVERNLRSPLVGVRQAAARLGVTVPEVTVGIRTGDTPASQRRTFATRPPDVLITTPESLFLVLTSGARAGLEGVRTVVVDEIHAVAGTKRGAHLAVSLERLDAMLEAGPGPAQRIGLSATVRPVEAVASFLTGSRAPHEGGREVVVVQPPSTKRIEVDVVLPVPDLTDLASAPRPAGAGEPDLPALDEPDLTGAAAGPARRASVWPHVEERIVDLVAEHRATLVFTNSRRGAERLTSRMNEVWAERTGQAAGDPGELQPAAVPGQSGTSSGVDTRDAAHILARAHHGSMSRAERTRTESELKSGDLPAVVATSSLELGIDMGAVDLVVQVGAPPSVASGLQRVGRAGHQVGAVSRGVVFPTFRGELVASAVTAQRMRGGELEALHVPANPLDVLAQQVVAMTAVDAWPVAELARVVRRAAPFAGLGDATLHAVLDMLAGRYPSEEFAELRPRIVWDRTTDVLTGRPGALRLAVTSGGTIPDRGLFGVFLAGETTDGVATDPTVGAGGRQRGGRRVGELDEEMVYESRAGDTFTLGSSTWRIEQITTDRVLVSPAPGVPGRLPFWKGDAPGRPAELGRAMGAWVREVAASGDEAAAATVRAAGLDEWAGANLLAYLRDQRDATGVVPDDRTIVVERFRDEIGDWRIVLHSPYGARVHAPWAVVLGARLRDRYGVDAAVMHSDDGIVLRLPDMLDSELDSELDAEPDAVRHPVRGSGDPWSGTANLAPGGTAGPSLDLADLLLDADDVVTQVRTELGSSALFAARFREAAARALLLPRRSPDRRQPLWQQRQRASQLLAVAARHPDFPILLEAVRECLQDDFDTAALATLMREVARGEVRVVEVTTTNPSPFAQSLLLGYTAQFLYEGDAPLAERRAAALTLDPTLLAELLGHSGASQLADLLDPDAVLAVEAELAAQAPERQAATLEQLADVVRRHGPLTHAELATRVRAEVRDRVATWLDELESARRVIRVRLAGVAAHRSEQWAAIEDAGRLRDALGVALPVGIPEAFTEVLPDPVADLVRRFARTHGPFGAHALATRFGWGVAVAAPALARLEAAGALVHGRLRPDELGGTGDEYCDADVLRTLRRRSLAALRSQVEPVDPQALGVFLPRWQSVAPVRGRASGDGLRGVDGVARAVEQLAGFVLPASALETHVLPSRVVDYRAEMLDELLSAGEVLWAGHGTLPGNDGLVSLHPTADADLTLALVPDDAASRGLSDTLARTVLDALGAGGGWFLGALTQRVRASRPEQDGAVSERDVADALWGLVWAGLVTNDGLGPLRALLGAGRTAHRTRAAVPRARALRPRLGLRGEVAARDTASGTGIAAGRWSVLPARESDPTLRAHALAAQLLDRHGVLTRAVAPLEGVGGVFTDVYKVLGTLEQGGQVRRGYFVERSGGSQFALPGAVDRLRSDAQVVVAARDRAQDRADRVASSEYVAPAAQPTPGARPPGPRAGQDRERHDEVVVVLAATDPANPYGGAVAWPQRQAETPATTTPRTGPAVRDGSTDPAAIAVRHRPGRKAGALVVLVDGALVLYLERGGRTVLTFSAEPDVLASAATGLATVARRTGRLTVSRIDGAGVLADGAARSPAGVALVAAGFATTPRGLRLGAGT